MIASLRSGESGGRYCQVGKCTVLVDLKLRQLLSLHRDDTGTLRYAVIRGDSIGECPVARAGIDTAGKADPRLIGGSARGRAARASNSSTAMDEALTAMVRAAKAEGLL